MKHDDEYDNTKFQKSNEGKRKKIIKKYKVSGKEDRSPRRNEIKNQISNESVNKKGALNMIHKKLLKENNINSSSNTNPLTKILKHLNSSDGNLENFAKKEIANDYDKKNIYDVFKDYIEIDNNALSNSDNKTKATLDGLKMIKERVFKSIKDKRLNKNKGNKNKIEGVKKQYLNLLSFDRKDDSCFDDDLFFLKGDLVDQKTNKKRNKIEGRRKYRLKKKKLKKIIHKKNLTNERKKNPFILSIDEFLETEKDQESLDKFLKNKMAKLIETKGQLDFEKDQNISKNYDEDESLFDNLKDKKNKDINHEKEIIDINQNINNPDKKYKRTFEMNLIPNKSVIDDLRFKFKLDYRLIPIFWSNSEIIRNHSMDNNFPDVFNNVYVKIKEDYKKDYIEKIKEGIQRYENIDKSKALSINENREENENSDIIREGLEARNKYEEERKRKFKEIEGKLQELKIKFKDTNQDNINNEKPDEQIISLKNYELMQRLYKYNQDLKTILRFWRDNLGNLKSKKEAIKNLNIKKPEDAENKELNIVKKINKKEIGVKYDFKKPEENIKNLIPLCNDIFTILKNEQ